MARVIRAERSGPAIVRAELQSVRERASRILADAAEEAEALRAAAREQGRAAGLADAARQLLEVARARASALQEVQQSGLHAVLLVAAALLGDAVRAEPERILELLDPQLERVRRARWVVLHLHPEDARWLEQHAPELSERAGYAGQLELRADPEIARGGCLLESNLGELDARIETRLAELDSALGLRAAGAR
jgi:flagellar biosynthesis/type III secretory pathway protein FliH